jgi:pimeloyl-ACP methyl ester carboxylesterase
LIRAERTAALTLPGGRFATFELGDPAAPLVLCLHGFPDHAPSFSPLAEELAAAGYRVVAPWMRGYAPSTLAGPFDLFQIGADVLELARALGGGIPAAVVGHDWGAIATYAAALLDPEAFSCAVTLAIPHPLAFVASVLTSPAQLRRSWYIFFFQLPGLPERALARDDFALVRRLWRDWSPGFELSEPRWRELRGCLEQSMPAPIQYYRAIPRSLSRASWPRRFRVSVPLLYLHGADDGCAAPATAARQTRLFSGPLVSEILDGVGHFLHLEDPGRVASRILPWLERHHRAPVS